MELKRKRYCQMTLRGPRDEELDWLFFENGALSIEVLDDETFQVLTENKGKVVSQIEKFAKAHQIVTVSTKFISDKNWIQECPELMQPLQIGKLRIEFVRDEQTELEKKAHTIYLKPSYGFGTGHHESTHMAVELLLACERLLEDEGRERPQSILDFGTGSGVLAIVAAQLLNNTVDALDCEAEAIANARENVAINELSDKILLRVGNEESLSESYDLILANIYAELLCQFEPLFKNHSRKAGYLIVSGILAEKVLEVEKTYSEAWRLLEKKILGNWCALLFQKKL